MKSLEERVSEIESRLGIVSDPQPERADDESLTFPVEFAKKVARIMTTDPGIIRAAEGVTLEPGEYEVVDISVDDDSHHLAVGSRFTICRPERAIWRSTGALWTIASHTGNNTWVTAVRRVEAQPERAVTPDISARYEIVGAKKPERAGEEPVDPGARAHYDTGISKVGGKLQCDPAECHKYQTHLLEKVERLTGERDEAVAKITELESVARDRIADFTFATNSSEDRAKKAERNLKTAVEDCELAAKERDEARSKLATEQAKNAELWQGHAELHARCTQAEAQVAKLTEETWRLGSEIEKGHHKILALTEELERVDAAIGMTPGNESKRLEVLNYVRSPHSLRSYERAETEAKIRELESGNASLNAQLDMWQDTTRKLESELAACREELALERDSSAIPRSIGARMIAKERERQVSEESWTPEHDDEHDRGELGRAAACYAMGESTFRLEREGSRVRYIEAWPWDGEWDKRGDTTRIRDLEKAGALCAAEIDRLLRALPDSYPEESSEPVAGVEAPEGKQS